MNEEPIRFAIIGTSGIAEMHARCLQALPRCRLSCLLASTEERAILAQEKFQVPVYHAWSEMLANHDLDAVVICTASGKHLPAALSAVSAGLHILCEKPLEVTIDRALQMQQAAGEAGVKLGGVFQNRFNPDFIKLKGLIDSGTLGKVLMANAYIKWYRSSEYYTNSPWKGTIAGDGGAALINQGIHTVDLLLELAGGVESVFAKTRTALHDIEGEDLAVALLTFNNGAIGTIEAGTAIYPGFAERIEITGTLGTAILEGGKLVTLAVVGEESTETVGEDLTGGSGASDPMAINDQGHLRQLGEFAEAIANDREPSVSGRSALAALHLIENIYKSAQSGLEVSVKSL